MLDRRTFLRRLGFGTVAAAAAATNVFDLEKLLWIPGEKTIFLPSDVRLHTPDWVIEEALRILNGKLTLSRAITREYDNVKYISIRRADGAPVDPISRAISIPMRIVGSGFLARDFPFTFPKD